MSKKWHYDGKRYCRPVFTYNEIEDLMQAVENAEGKMNKVLYAKLMHYRNRMNEKAYIEGNEDER